MTTLSKRSFVISAASSLAAPLAWGHAAPHVTAAVLPSLGNAPGLHDWQAYLHQPFTLQTEGGSHTVVLNRISPVGIEPALHQFVLGFVGSANGRHLPSGTYCLLHTNGQGAHLHLGDAGLHGQQQNLRAEFSLLPTVA